MINENNEIKKDEQITQSEQINTTEQTANVFLDQNNPLEQSTNQKFVPINSFDKLKVDKLYANLPIFTAIPSYEGKQGEIILVNDGSSLRKICIYMNGAWYCSTMVASAGGYGGGTPEDFTTFTQVDPNAHIITTSARTTAINLGTDETAYCYKDKGADYFNGDFTHYVDVMEITGGAGADNAIWMIANDLNDTYNLDADSESYLAIKIINSQLCIQECDSGTAYTSATYSVTDGTTYYLVISRVEADGAFGTMYLYIYSNFERTNLLAIKSLVLHSSKKDFRYIYSAASYNDGTPAIAVTEYCENLVL